MNILLLFPPESSIEQPYLSLPCLKAYLIHNGFTHVKQKDINVEMFDYMLTKDFLLSIQDEIKLRFKTLDNKCTLKFGECIEFERLNNALAKYKYVLDNIETAKENIKTKKLPDVTLYKSRKIVHYGTKIIKAARVFIDSLHGEYVDKYSQSTDQFVRFVLENRNLLEKDIYVRYYQENIIPYISSGHYDLIGISIPYATQLINGLVLADLIKRTFKKAHVVIGGSTISDLVPKLKIAQDIFKIVDSIVVYTGERALLELTQQLSCKEDLSEVPNLIYYDRKLKTTVATKIHFEEDINELPTPCFDDFDFNKYLSNGVNIPLAITTGCYWQKCAFCTINELHPHYQERKLDFVLDDLHVLVRKYSAKKIDFVGDVISVKMVDDLCKRIIENKIEIEWETEIRLDKALTKDILERMVRAGCYKLRFGLESGCQRLLDIMEKGTNKVTNRRIIKEAHDAGIRTMVYCIVGFPSETPEEVDETLDFIVSNREYIDEVGSHSFVLNEGSKVMAAPEQYGISDVRIKDFDSSEYTYRVKTGMNILEIQKKMRDFNRKISESVDKENLQLRNELKWRKKRVNRIVNNSKKTNEFLNLVPQITSNVVYVTSHYDLEMIYRKIQEHEDHCLHSVLNSNISYNEATSNMANNSLISHNDGQITILRNIEYETSFYVNPDTLFLLNLCDGTTTVGEIISKIPKVNQIEAKEFIIQLVSLLILQI